MSYFQWRILDLSEGGPRLKPERSKPEVPRAEAAWIFEDRVTSLHHTSWQNNVILYNIILSLINNMHFLDTCRKISVKIHPNVFSTIANISTFCRKSSSWFPRTYDIKCEKNIQNANFKLWERGAAHQMMNLHETEGQSDVNWVGRVAHWSNAFVVSTKQISKQSFFVVERRWSRHFARILCIFCLHIRGICITSTHHFNFTHSTYFNILVKLLLRNRPTLQARITYGVKATR